MMIPVHAPPCKDIPPRFVQLVAEQKAVVRALTELVAQLTKAKGRHGKST